MVLMTNQGITRNVNEKKVEFWKKQGFVVVDVKGQEVPQEKTKKETNGKNASDMADKL